MLRRCARQELIISNYLGEEDKFCNVQKKVQIKKVFQDLSYKNASFHFFWNHTLDRCSECIQAGRNDRIRTSRCNRLSYRAFNYIYIVYYARQNLVLVKDTHVRP